MKAVFDNQNQSLPTRIYSDVTKLNSPQSKKYVLARLKSLSYTYSTFPDSITFKLRPIQYPSYLIPEAHPTFQAQDQLVRLNFDENSESGILQSIYVNDQEVSELFLEPELVATFSQSKDGKDEIRVYLKFKDIPANVWNAIISVEDQHFLDHVGFDLKGLLRAVWVNLKTRSFAQGGSTITQQLVKNLTARTTKNLIKKFNELFLSILLEIRYSKQEILERYLNEVYLGQIGNLEIRGVAEGARYFFGKNVNELNTAEIALMAGLIRGPAYYSPYRHLDRAKERQAVVLRKMLETGHLAPEEAKEAQQMPIRLAPPASNYNKAPYFTDYVKAEVISKLSDRMNEEEIIQAGLQIYSTLDPYLNDRAQESVNEQVKELEAKHQIPSEIPLEGALASVEHSTGYIRALIGGRSYQRSSFNRILNMKRQVGSTFKPLVFLSALIKGTDANGVPYGPAYPLQDAPWTLTYDQGRQKWSPSNYEKDHRGWISMRVALAHSVNTVAAQLGNQVGLKSIADLAKNLGVESELPLVPSLTLGAAELSPIELLRVYSAFANHGKQDDLTVIRGIMENNGKGLARFEYNPRTLIAPEFAEAITDLLQDVFIDGTAQAASSLGWTHSSAGKTGTTSNYRDSWFAGYTSWLTTVVWVGLDQGTTGELKTKKAMRLTGASAALPVWVDFMKKAHENLPPTPFATTTEFTQVKIDRKSGKRATPDCPEDQVVLEKYILGREPEESFCAPDWPEY